VLTPLPELPADVATVAAAWAACGAVPQLTPADPEGVRRGRHLPHLAFGLVDDTPAARRAAVPVRRQRLSRLHPDRRLSPEMWRDISLANRDALLGELDAYLAQLTAMRALLAAADGAGIEAVYANAQRARRQWTGAIESAEAPRAPDTAE
jgi:prephenate dehydrogenase